MGDVCECQGASAGQTMTEYALILPAVAVAVFVGQMVMGNNIRSPMATVDGQL
jgi:Flp pilus assembly pilin Flp